MASKAASCSHKTSNNQHQHKTLDAQSLNGCPEEPPGMTAALAQTPQSTDLHTSSRSSERSKKQKQKQNKSQDDYPSDIGVPSTPTQSSSASSPIHTHTQMDTHLV